MVEFWAKGQLGVVFAQISVSYRNIFFDLTSSDFQTGHQKLEKKLESVLKIISYQKMSITKNVLLNWHFYMQKNERDSVDFRHWKLTLKIRLRHFLTTRLKVSESQWKSNQNMGQNWHILIVFSLLVSKLSYSGLWAGGAMALPDFCRSVNPISTWGGGGCKLCPPHYYRPPRISDIPTAPCAEGRSTGGSRQAGLTLSP